LVQKNIEHLAIFLQTTRPIYHQRRQTCRIKRTQILLNWATIH
jgi:hypothetical protein